MIHRRNNSVDDAVTGDARNSTNRKLRLRQERSSIQHQRVVPQVSPGLAEADTALLTGSTEGHGFYRSPRRSVGPTSAAATSESPGPG
jgi:hypothetical protein